MSNLFVHQQWLLIAIIFFGIIGYIAWIRRRDHKWIESRFGKRQTLAISFGINYFGRATEPGTPKRSSGFLLLFPERLFYRSRLAGLEVDVPTDSIHRVYHGTSHKSVELHQSVVKVDFLTSKGERDTVAFKVPYPPQWIQVIEMAVKSKTTTATR